MVVNKNTETPPDLAQLDLGYLALFLGLRINELVTAALIKAGFHDVRERHGYVIQHLVERDRTISELARRMEVTQQAASKAAAELVAIGVIEMTAGDDRRSKRLQLTTRGRTTIARARAARRRIEGRLIAALGAAQYAAAQETLRAALHTLGGVERIRGRRVRMPGA